MAETYGRPTRGTAASAGSRDLIGLNRIPVVFHYSHGLKRNVLANNRRPTSQCLPRANSIGMAFSLEPDELKALVVETERAFLSLGDVQLNTQESEEKSRQFRRSIYVVEDIKPGESFSEKNIKVIRPGDGLPPKYYLDILNKKAKVSVKKGSPLSWDFIS